MGGVDNIGNSLVLTHDTVVVAIVGDEEVTFTVFFFVAGNETLGRAQTWGWEAVGDEVDSGSGSHDECLCNGMFDVLGGFKSKEIAILYI